MESLLHPTDGQFGHFRPGLPTLSAVQGANALPPRAITFTSCAVGETEDPQARPAGGSTPLQY